MNIRKNQAIILAIEAGVFLLSLLCLCVQKCSSFVGYSRVGVIVLLIDMLLFCKAQKKIITVQTLFLGMFILFQFGLPIIYAFSPKHYNFYLSVFDEEIITTAVKYTVMAIQLYIIAATFVVAFSRSSEKPGKQGKWARIMLTHTKDVENAGLLLFAVTAVVAVPVNLWASVQALTAEGDIGNLYRGAMSANGLTRFMQEFFFSSALLYLCFSRKKIGRKMVTILYFTVAFAMVIVADRTGGVTALVVYALYWYYTSSKKQRKKHAVILIFVGVALAVISSIVANVRSGAQGEGELLFAALEEMGFNFTSLCFVMDYIPAREEFRWGISYLIAIVLLIPKTLGLGVIYPQLQSYLGETWLYNANSYYGRDYLSFGVGFSMIAESYYNFSWAGILVMIPLGLIITWFIKEKRTDTPWNLYIRLALMLNFFTVPRRQFQSVVKGLEYSVFFMGIYIMLYIYGRRLLCRAAKENRMD